MHRAGSFVAVVALAGCAPRTMSTRATPPLHDAPRAPMHHWVNHALQERCDAPPSPPPTVSSTSTAPVASRAPALELPPALARYPLLGRIDAGCGVFGNCSGAIPSEPLGAIDTLPRRPFPVVQLFGEATDCVTREALIGSLSRARISACIAETNALPCVDWHWLSTTVRIEPPRGGRVSAMTGHEAVSVATASCLARAVQETPWIAHESDTPLEVRFVVAWRDGNCLFR